MRHFTEVAVESVKYCVSCTLQAGKCENVANSIRTETAQGNPGDAGGSSNPEETGGAPTAGTLDSKFNVFETSTEGSGEKSTRHVDAERD